MVQVDLDESKPFATFYSLFMSPKSKWKIAMKRLFTTLALMTSIFFVSTTSFAQAPTGLFKWQKGQQLTYKVEHSTVATEIIADSKSEFKNLLELTKRWVVEDVTAEGVATLTLVVESIKMKSTNPKGDELTYDSANPKDSTPQLKDQLEKYIGTKIATIVMDTQGRVRSVKESNFGAASKYEVELPFAVVVPAEEIKKGLAWQRNFNITMDPPQGTGEKYESSQKYECNAIESGKIKLKVTTELKKAPENIADQLPLLPFLVEGDVTLDPQKGLMLDSILKVDKTLKGHQGENSSYRMYSLFKETLISSK